MLVRARASHRHSVLSREALPSELNATHSEVLTAHPSIDGVLEATRRRNALVQSTLRARTRIDHRGLRWVTVGHRAL